MDFLNYFDERKPPEKCVGLLVASWVSVHISSNHALRVRVYLGHCDVALYGRDKAIRGRWDLKNDTRGHVFDDSDEKQSIGTRAARRLTKQFVFERGSPDYKLRQEPNHLAARDDPAGFNR
ncbi:hypothetical protein J6590_092935 [Homalodisca vitripennis]|nr:hypothetical protein J6590_092935 [Homalodisca vitripennis]